MNAPEMAEEEPIGTRRPRFWASSSEAYTYGVETMALPAPMA